jgi:hypothetical protein
VEHRHQKLSQQSFVRGGHFMLYQFICHLSLHKKNLSLQSMSKLTMVVYTCNSSTCETEARRSQVGGYPGLYTKTLSQEKGYNLK